MQNSFLNLLSSALVPVLCADVAAGTSCNVHFRLIAVVAIGAFPDELAVGVLFNKYFSVKSAHLTEVAFGIQLSVHNMVVYIFHNSEHGIEVVLHIGNLDVGDCAARGESLEFRLKLKLCKCVDWLGYVNVIGVCYIIFNIMSGNLEFLPINIMGFITSIGAMCS